jgi:hypothetical protein
MTDQAALSAVYVDYRRVKTRKVMQIVFEVPIERWPTVYPILGEPDIDNSMWFALARLQGVPGEKLKGGSLAQQAGILCNDGTFIRWAHEHATGEEEFHGMSSEAAAEYIRFHCGVKSRAHLDHDAEAARRFRDLKADYELWLRDIDTPQRNGAAA